MPNIFDAMEESMFNVIGRTFGDDVVWIPSAGGDAITALALLKNPTKGKELLGITYDPRQWTFEYHVSNFVGLFDRVRAGNNEIITSKGIIYTVMGYETKYDGDTLVANVIPNDL